MTQLLTRTTTHKFPLQEGILKRHVRDPATPELKPNWAQDFIAVGQHLVLFGYDGRDMAVYEPVSGSLTLAPLDPEDETRRNWDCVVPVSATEIIAINSVSESEDPACSKNITKHSISRGGNL